MTVDRTDTGTEEGPPTLHRPAPTIVELHGDIDFATSPALRERLLDTLNHSTRLLILDLSGVLFCDASGLAAMMGTRRRAHLLGICLQLAAPRPPVMRLLRITGLDRVLTIHPTLHDALTQEHHECIAVKRGSPPRPSMR